MRYLLFIFLILLVGCQSEGHTVQNPPPEPEAEPRIYADEYSFKVRPFHTDNTNQVQIFGNKVFTVTNRAFNVEVEITNEGEYANLRHQNIVAQHPITDEFKRSVFFDIEDKATHVTSWIFSEAGEYTIEFTDGYEIKPVYVVVGYNG